jgi:GTP-binding protein HflX
LIFDDELSPSQIHHIEREYQLEIIDRTELILNIFYMHAKTTEARLEIRLAELYYEKPRLRNNTSGLDRIGGSAGGASGLASRGSGETKLELDRRSIEIEIQNIKDDLKKIEAQKETQAKLRANVKKICLVGYTNAGKSTLFNALTGADVYVQDQLFATLTSTSRQLDLFPGCEAVLSDTVGFIAKLPHQLVASFTATLKEVKDADLLLHIIDISDNDYKIYIDEVNKVLNEIGVGDTPVILVYNKTDRYIKEHGNMDCFGSKARNVLAMTNTEIVISALQKTNIESLLDAIRNHLFAIKEYKLLLPYSEQKLVALLHEKGIVIEKEFTEQGIRMFVRVSQEHQPLFEKFIKATARVP